jgi:hypothetical protein
MIYFDPTCGEWSCVRIAPIEGRVLAYRLERPLRHFSLDDELYREPESGSLLQMLSSLLIDGFHYSSGFAWGHPL